MPITSAGVQLIVNALFGSTITPYNAANAYIGVGDSTAVFSAAQTALQASTNKAYKPMDSGFPTQNLLTLTFQSTFQSADANFAWNEVAFFNAAAGGGVMIDRFVPSPALGIKTSSQTWTLSVAVTFAPA